MIFKILLLKQTLIKMMILKPNSNSNSNKIENTKVENK